MRLSQNMKNQEALLKSIRNKIPKSASLIEEIASVLEISYDASHRRISEKSKFSIDETIKLALHFSISLDTLFLNKENVVVEKTIEITTMKDMLEYFKSSSEQIEILTKNPQTILFYSAKDIPLFYFMDGTILSKFKAFVWLNLLNNTQKKVSFENFVIEESFSEYMQKLKKAYEKTFVNEIWNDTTINSSLQQILYFYEAGLLNLNSANALCKDLKRIINLIQEKCNNTSNNFALYYNELILLNNNMLIDTEEKLTMFVPYTLLGYFITDNEESCKNVHQFFKQQIINSKPLGQSGIKEQNLFFNRIIRKIDYYTDKINTQVDLLF